MFGVRSLVGTARDGSETQLQNAIDSIASCLVNEGSSIVPSGGGLCPLARRIVQDLVEQRLVGGVSVAQMAEAAGLSLHHFIKAYKRSEGGTPHALLVRKRLERSIYLLLTYKATVEEVALMTGFYSSSHFIRVFRKCTGVTPADFQQAARI